MFVVFVSLHLRLLPHSSLLMLAFLKISMAVFSSKKEAALHQMMHDCVQSV
jgi:hypothetical protein